MVNDLRLSFMRSANVVGTARRRRGAELASQGFVTGVGTPGIVPGLPKIEGIENVIFNSFVMGVPITNLAQANNTFGINDNFSKVWGNHTFKTGFQGSYEQINVNPNPTANGSFLFAGTETGLGFRGLPDRCAYATTIRPRRALTMSATNTRPRSRRIAGECVQISL